MIYECDKGGINMHDIESYFLSLKAPCLYRIHNSCGPWTYISICSFNFLCPYDVLMQMSFQSISELHCLKIYTRLLSTTFAGK